MKTLRILLALALGVAGFFPLRMAAATVPPEYGLGDLATEDVITPVALRVVNPDASEVLKQRAAERVPLAYRRVGPAADEAEAELRAGIDAARTSFLAALRQALHGRVPNAGDVDSPAYIYTVRVAARENPQHPPLAQLAPLWVRGVSDAALVDAMVQPLRAVMARPIVDDKGEAPLPVDQPIRLFQVRDLLEIPSLQALETGGVPATAAELSSLEWSRSVVEAYFSANQDEMARFSSAFLRPNTFPAPGLTGLLRARRRDAATVNDTYAAGQTIVHRGQPVDREALRALAALRELQLMDSLAAGTGPKPSDDRPIMTRTEWLSAGFGAVCLVVLLILWRRWARSANPRLAVSVPPAAEAPFVLAEADPENWRTRALVAERRAAEAHDAIRRGALGWMREKIFRSIFRQRAELLSTQQQAAAEMHELERRLEQLLVPLQGRIRAYEKRIEELEQALAAQGGRDPGIIGARITATKQKLEVERARYAVAP